MPNPATLSREGHAMADNDEAEPPTDDTHTTHVEVVTPVEHEEPPPPPEPAPDTTVVVSDPGIHPAVAEFMSETRTQLAAMAGQASEAQSTAEESATIAASAAASVDEAVEGVQEVAAGVVASVADATPTPTAESDVSPHKPHPWFRGKRR